MPHYRKNFPCSGRKLGSFNVAANVTPRCRKSEGKVLRVTNELTATALGRSLETLFSEYWCIVGLSRRLATHYSISFCLQVAVAASMNTDQPLATLCLWRQLDLLS